MHKNLNITTLNIIKIKCPAFYKKINISIFVQESKVNQEKQNQNFKVFFKKWDPAQGGDP